MERTAVYEDDLIEERPGTPVEREENEHIVALGPDFADDDDDDDDDEEEEEDLDD